MTRYLLDTSALLTLRDDEDGADTVAEILQAAQSSRVQVIGCFISLMEILYRVWKDETEAEGRLAYEQCQELPIVWIRESPDLLEKAGEVKATHPISLADAWIAGCALLNDAQLVNKDPEFESIKLEQLKLPYKRKLGSE